MNAAKIAVVCPNCGHTQREPPAAYSTRCKKCHAHFRLEDVLHPVAKPANHQVESRRISCFKCATELEVPVSALSTMCKRCGSHVDLRDYHITNAVSKNFKTKGRFVIETGGFLFNTETVAGDAVIKGRLLGQLTAERSLEIHTSADIKGKIKAAELVVPAGERFRWPEPLELTDAKIHGELVADLRARGTVAVFANARVFGNIEARDLAVQEGAVLVGELRIGRAARFS